VELGWIKLPLGPVLLVDLGPKNDELPSCLRPGDKTGVARQALVETCAGEPQIVQRATECAICGLMDSCLLRLETPRTVLTLAGPDAAPRLVDYFVRNQTHHAPWDPPRPPGFLTVPFWQERLSAQVRELAEDCALRMVVFGRGAEDGPVIGLVNFTNIQRGPFQACQLGYSLDLEAVGA